MQRIPVLTSVSRVVGNSLVNTLHQVGAGCKRIMKSPYIDTTSSYYYLHTLHLSHWLVLILFTGPEQYSIFAPRLRH